MMKLSERYASDLTMEVLSQLDMAYQQALKALKKQMDSEKWTPRQRKTQQINLLPSIALYRTLQQLGISKEKARALIRKRVHRRARKAHKVLKRLFRLPGFSRVFRFVMRKGLTREDIWHIEPLQDNREQFAINIHKCLWVDTCQHCGCPEICDLFCEADHITFGNIDAMTFQRTETLATGGEKCDFRFLFHR